MESPPASEWSVIARIAERLGTGSSDPRVLVASGDDCAVLRLDPQAGTAQRLNSADLVATSDLLVEGVHFDLRLSSLADVGYKALAVNLSDLAAMGARPAFALGSLGLPPGASAAAADELIGGVGEAQALAHESSGAALQLIGGDTVAAPQWIIGFTLLGETSHAPMLRSGARPGDLIWHSGGLGLAQTGLHVLLGSLGARSKIKAADYPLSVAAQRRPRPQLALGNFLAREGLASACLDLSDSLSQCLLLLAKASGVGLDIDLTRYSAHPEVEAFLKLQALKTGGISLPARLSPRSEAIQFESAAEYLLASAEDYELLFTAPPQATARLLSASPVPLTRLGTVLDAGEGCLYRTGSRSRELVASGWEHLG